MDFFTRRSSWLRLAGLPLLAVLLPATAQAQYQTPSADSTAVGEKYHVELSGSLWNTDPAGSVTSGQFGTTIGSTIDFVDDLEFTRRQFRDFRLVLRPSKKSRFRIQYTPVEFESEVVFKQDVVFAGSTFKVNVPIEARFAWHVWRVGYEYDFVYKSRGFVGVLFEGRYTQMEARLTTNTPLLDVQKDEYILRAAPLPAIGIVARGYIAPRLAVDFEVSGLKIPTVYYPATSPSAPPQVKYGANYYDWDVHGTFNATKNIGIQGGWRRMTTFLAKDSDTGDVKFQGLWFGGALRF